MPIAMQLNRFLCVSVSLLHGRHTIQSEIDEKKALASAAMQPDTGFAFGCLQSNLPFYCARRTSVYCIHALSCS